MSRSSRPTGGQELELVVPADDMYLPVLRTTCTSIATGLELRRTTVEVLRNALDSAASDVLYTWPEAEELHAVYRVTEEFIEIDLFPRPRSREDVAPGVTAGPVLDMREGTELDAAPPRMCCAGRRPSLSEDEAPRDDEHAVPTQRPVTAPTPPRVEIHRIDPVGLRVVRRLTTQE